MSKRTKRFALINIGIAVLVLGLKLLAWRLTGSIALYSDALESVVNVVTAIAAFIAIGYAIRPADQKHPYGHSKAEYFSAVLEGVMIIIAAILIFREAISGLLNPVPIVADQTGIVVNVLASVINGFWAYQLISKGNQYNSPALRADGVHLRADVISSLAVVVGVTLVFFTSWWWLDPLLALLVALNILWHGWALISASMGGLLDEAVPNELLFEIEKTISSSADGAIEVHDIRTRRAGQLTFVDFHLVVDGSMSVTQSHKICDHIEDALREKTPDIQVTIHVEPEHKAKHDDALLI